MAIKSTHVPVLRQLCRCNKKVRKQILEQGGKPLQLSLRECALNLLKGNIPLSKRQINRLKKHKNQLREISKRSTSQKRRFQIEQRGGFLASLLVPIVGSLVGAAVQSAVKR